MRKRRWKKPAGCFAISLYCALALAARTGEWRTGAAQVGQVTAVAVEDAAGNRAVIAQAAYALQWSQTEALAARAMKEFGLERGAVLLRGASTGQPERLEDAFDAMGAALGALAQSRLHYADGSLWLEAAHAELRADGEIRLHRTAPAGAAGLTGRIRTAFQMADLNQGLERRDEPARAAPLQAIAFGKQAAILALPGNAPTAQFARPGVLAWPYANQAGAFPDGQAVREAAARALKRVGR